MGSYRIGSQPAVVPQSRRTANKENVAPRPAPSGRQARTRQGAFADLDTRRSVAGRAPLRSLDANAGTAKPRLAASAPQPRSVRTPGHGVSASNVSVQHHRDRVLNQIEHLPVEGSRRAWRKPIEAMELLDRHAAHLSPAQTIKLLQQMQVILSIKDGRTRDANLDHFVAGLKPAIAPQTAKPAPSPAARPSKPVLSSQAQPRPQFNQSTFRQFEEQATLRERQARAQAAAARPNRPLASSQPQPQASNKLGLSFKDVEGLVPLRQQHTGRSSVAATPVRAPQYGRSASSATRPAQAQVQEPRLTLADFERFEAQDAEQEHRHTNPYQITDRAQQQYAAYLARLNGEPPQAPERRRASSAPPRIQTAPAPELSYLDRQRLNREVDDAGRYHNETGGHRHAYEAELARRQPMPSMQGAARPRRKQTRELTAAEKQFIHQDEAERARHFHEEPNNAIAEADYRARHGL